MKSQKHNLFSIYTIKLGQLQKSLLHNPRLTDTRVANVALIHICTGSMPHVFYLMLEKIVVVLVVHPQYPHDCNAKYCK